MIDVKERIELSAGLAFIAILAATIFPRLMVLGGLPTTDEGFYAYQAQVIHSTLTAGEGLPNDGFLAIYPMLLSWVFEFTANHFVLLRLVDLVVAAVAAYILFLVLKRESGSLFGGALISFVFLFIMNQPLFIQTGFKNSIFAAYVPLFFALKMTQNFKRDEYKGWGYVGILVVLAVLLRETFLYFFLVATLSAYIIGGWRAF